MCICRSEKQTPSLRNPAEKALIFPRARGDLIFMASAAAAITMNHARTFLPPSRSLLMRRFALLLLGCGVLALPAMALDDKAPKTEDTPNTLSNAEKNEGFKL